MHYVYIIVSRNGLAEEDQEEEQNRVIQFIEIL